ncbi:MAG: hypothetical protein RLZZ423_1879 [Cyanobacteriota bacterium]|jgi:hypothetical protein
MAPARRRAALGLLVPLLAGLALPLAAAAQTSVGAPDPLNPFRKPQEQRPEGLVLLREWETMEGPHAIGVYDAKRDATDPSARTIVVWLEEPSGVKLAVESLRCSPEAPMRLTRRGRDLLIRELNPGGTISDANRLDHQIWWAACVPEQAGKDPASLAALARQLGYSGRLREQEQVVPARPR